EEKSAAALMAARLVGDPIDGSRAAIARMALGHISGGIVGKVRDIVGLRGRRRRGTQLLNQVIGDSILSRLDDHVELKSAIREGRAPLAEHRPMFDFVASLTRDVARGIAGAATEATQEGAMGELFDVVSAVLAQQSMLLPYYFALFLQNQERDL